MNLSVNNISKNFNSFTALKDINIEFSPGIWGLLGPNGAGKTTLMKLLVKNLKPSNGEILLDTHNIASLGDSYFDKIGYLPQYFGYDKNQNIEDFLNYIGALKGIKKNLRAERIEKLLTQFNLSEVRKKKIDNLSGGMIRRVGICQSMLNDPKILIIDEPTAGLDIEERRNFRKYLTSISKDKVVILSTHIVSDIEFIANYLLILEKGKLVVNGQSQPLIETLNNRVFETIVPEMDLDTLKDKIKIINFRNEGYEKVTIRYISDMLLPNSKSVTPSLNDFYLYEVQEV